MTRTMDSRSRAVRAIVLTIAGSALLGSLGLGWWFFERSDSCLSEAHWLGEDLASELRRKGSVWVNGNPLTRNLGGGRSGAQDWPVAVELEWTIEGHEVLPDEPKPQHVIDEYGGDIPATGWLVQMWSWSGGARIVVPLLGKRAIEVGPSRSTARPDSEVPDFEAVIREFAAEHGLEIRRVDDPGS